MMITVAVLINGQVVYARTAVNTTKGKYISDKENTYQLDTGEEIKHKPDHGAVILCKRMLDTIKEV